MFYNYKLDNDTNLKSIADKFQTTEEVLRNLNGFIDLDNLKKDLNIVVPEKTYDYYNYYTVSQGDSIYAISKKFNVNPELLMALNGLENDDYIYPNQQLLLPKKGYSYYITAEGDTIDEIVKLFGSNTDKFLKENSTIYLMSGQLLVNKK